jgi:dimethylhistidine N-methyltransferase
MREAGDFDTRFAELGQQPAIAYASTPEEPLAQFRHDVTHGLSRTPKRLPSVHLYDARGSELFRRIMELPEYYVTRVERAILERAAPRIMAQLLAVPGGVDVIDLGAGDGTKTRVLLQAACSAAERLRYLPIDVSPHALGCALAACRAELPWLQAQGVVAEYAEGIAWIARRDPARRRLVLLLGSNVGNMSRARTRRFLRELRRALRPGDQMLVGFDLLKDVDVLQRAYDDARGVTAEFNLNLLRRINRELGGDFDLGAFRHLAVFSPQRRAMESYLLSVRAQRVQVAGLCHAFAAWEPIRTEVSCKYRVDELRAFGRHAGLREAMLLTDELERFADVLWSVEPERRAA